MPYYSNEKSLKDTYGDAEVVGLLRGPDGQQSAARLAKAAGTAYAEINALLYAVGYEIPAFTAYGEDAIVGVPFINEMLQSISDCFTAYHLSASTDLSKKRYEDCRAHWLAWLKESDPLASPGQIVTVARPAVFNRFLRRERDIYPGGDDTYYGN